MEFLPLLLSNSNHADLFSSVPAVVRSRKRRRTLSPAAGTAEGALHTQTTPRSVIQGRAWNTAWKTNLSRSQGEQRGSAGWNRSGKGQQSRGKQEVRREAPGQCWQEEQRVPRMTRSRACSPAGAAVQLVGVFGLLQKKIKYGSNQRIQWKQL